MIYDAEESFAEYIFIETNTDQFVRGTPIKVTTRGADGLDETKARTVAAANAMPLLKRLRIGVSGVKIAGRPSIDLDNIGIYQSRIEPLAKSLDIHLFADRPAKLTVVSIPIVESMCEGFGGRSVAGKAMGYGLTLTMAENGTPPITLHQDRKLPNSRRCAADYGIAEAYLYRARNGSVTLAVLIEVEDNADYHAGPNRRFMVVTRQMKK